MTSSRSIATTARRVALGGAGFAVAATAFVAPATAHAATARNGVCETGEFCLSYNSGFQGSVADFAAGTNIPDLGATEPTCYDFKSTGAGKGICVKNHAAAARNLTGKPVTLYVNSNYGGATQVIPAGQTVNLTSALKNNEAAIKSTASTPTQPTGAVCVNNFGNPRSCAQAAAWMKARVGSYSSNYIGHCDMTMALAYGLGYSGSNDAASHWASVPAAYKHPGDRNVPAGALVFFTGGSHGHVMMSLGGGQFASTDIGMNGNTTGYISMTTISTVERVWGKKYAGWTEPWFVSSPRH